MVCTLIQVEHRNDTIKCSKLGSKTTPLRLMVPLPSFAHFMAFFSSVYKSADHEKNLVDLFFNNLFSVCYAPCYYGHVVRPFQACHYPAFKFDFFVIAEQSTKPANFV